MYCVQKFLLDNHISPYSRDPDQPIQKASSHLASPTLESQPLHNSILASPPTDPIFRSLETRRGGSQRSKSREPLLTYPRADGS
ncbi:hypothetical protein HO173_005483 [Letharia columbiana]|uniref:Uncharacterized protein n=1 Tax=Letharia columbiana TaxID=112416 RepID=A0A8H6FX06_9LECA|nr:uncharacterized protein HO173_005483 [Letharia columbiana]KAF6236391.1 hypothetical protein HO173_005483 [Letharia columbiana]